MTDVLQERISAIADRTDDSDWLDVKRRASRRRRRFVGPAAALVAAAVTAAAVAAGNGWLFHSHDRSVTAVTRVSLHGVAWRVTLTTRPVGGLARLCVRLSSAAGATVSGGCGRAPSRLLGPPFGARHFDIEGGQIWVGAAVGFTRRIAITSADGRVSSTRAITAPRGTKTPFRYWAVAIDSPARSITAYDARGRAITKRV
jgi:hypothetical protein